MPIDPQTSVGAIAVDHPLATRVFARHGIDFCCGGGRPLDEVCREKGVAIERLEAEIAAEIAGSPDPEIPWGDAPLEALIDHILHAYHEPLREELPRLEALARKVHQVHGPKDPERLQGVLDAVLAIKDDLEPHMQKEETDIFPAIRAGEGNRVADALEDLEREHEEVGATLRLLRELTRDYEVPEGACNTWRALWAGLADLERALHEHIHLENNILHERIRSR